MFLEYGISVIGFKGLSDWENVLRLVVGNVSTVGGGSAGIATRWRGDEMAAPVVFLACCWRIIGCGRAGTVGFCGLLEHFVSLSGTLMMKKGWDIPHNNHAKSNRDQVDISGFRSMNSLHMEWCLWHQCLSHPETLNPRQVSRKERHC